MTEQLHFHFSLSCIGEGNGNPLQCSCLENPKDGGAWWKSMGSDRLQSCLTLCDFAAAAVTGEILFQFFTRKEGHTELGCSDPIGLSTSSI